MPRRLSLGLAVMLCIGLFVCCFAGHVWPTKYRYAVLNGVQVRFNRF